MNYEDVYDCILAAIALQVLSLSLSIVNEFLFDESLSWHVCLPHHFINGSTLTFKMAPFSGGKSAVSPIPVHYPFTTWKGCHVAGRMSSP